MNRIYTFIFFLSWSFCSIGQTKTSAVSKEFPQPDVTKLDSMIFRVVSGDESNEERAIGSCFQKNKKLLILFIDLTCPYCEFKDRMRVKDAIELVRSLEKKHSKKFNVLFLHNYDESIKDYTTSDSIMNLIKENRITWLCGLSDFYFLRDFNINTCPSIIAFDESRKRLSVITPKDFEKVLNKKF